MEERLDIELDDDTIELIKAISDAEGITVNDFMARAISGFAKKNGRDHHSTTIDASKPTS